MRATAGLLALFFALTLTPGIAEACSCAGGVFYSLPAQGAQDVPLNPKIRLGIAFEGAAMTYELVSADGEIFTPEVVVGQSGDVVEVTLPFDGRLETDTAYEVVGDGRVVLSFTTGDAIDEAPPSLAAIAQFEGGYDDGCTPAGGGTISCDTCGGSTYLRLDYEGAEDDRAPADTLLYRVYVGLNGEIPNESSPSVLLPEGVPLGSGLCLTNLRGLEPGDEVIVRAATIDSAGNESALTEPARTVVSDDPDEGGGGGCASAPGQGGFAPAWCVLLGGMLLGGRRRSRG